MIWTLYDIMWYDLIWHNRYEYDMIWIWYYGMIWCKYDIIRYDMMWYGYDMI